MVAENSERFCNRPNSKRLWPSLKHVEHQPARLGYVGGSVGLASAPYRAVGKHLRCLEVSARLTSELPSPLTSLEFLSKLANFLSVMDQAPTIANFRSGTIYTCASCNRR